VCTASIRPYDAAIKLTGQVIAIVSRHSSLSPSSSAAAATGALTVR